MIVILERGRCQWLSAGDYQYYFSDGAYTQQEAVNRCSELSAHLTSISSEQEHAYLVTHMTR